MPMVRAFPALPVRQIAAAAAFYRDSLGFEIGLQDERFAIVTRDDVELHLWAAADESWKWRPAPLSARPVVSGAESFLAGTTSCRIEVQRLDELFAEYQQAGVLCDPSASIASRPGGTREFAALDLERNLLTFFERTR